MGLEMNKTNSALRRLTVYRKKKPQYLPVRHSQWFEHTVGGQRRELNTCPGGDGRGGLVYSRP